MLGWGMGQGKGGTSAFPGGGGGGNPKATQEERLGSSEDSRTSRSPHSLGNSIESGEVQNAGHSPPRGSTEAGVPLPSFPSPPPFHTQVVVAEAENYGLQLLLVTFANCSFRVILHLTDVVLLKLILHANTANLLTQLFASVEGEPL